MAPGLRPAAGQVHCGVYGALHGPLPWGSARGADSAYAACLPACTEQETWGGDPQAKAPHTSETLFHPMTGPGSERAAAEVVSGLPTSRTHLPVGAFLKSEETHSFKYVLSACQWLSE